MEPTDTLISTKITKDQWKGKLAEWGEYTTTSPFGRNLGHFKALMHSFEEALETDERREMYQKREDIIDTHIGLLNYAV
eukprot:2085156-Ditylum_brightwellii.AAC.1